MAKGKAEIDVDALLAEVETKPIRAHCWIESVTDDKALDFIDRVREKKRGNGFVNMSEVRRILVEHFKISIGLARVQAHIKDECVCPRREKRTR